MRIRPYKPCDARYIIQWIQDKKTLFQWSADLIQTFPLTEEALNRHYDSIANNDSFWQFTATDDKNVPIGHFILRYLDLDTVNIGFVIVNDTMRGNGYGKQMVMMARDYAFTMLQAKTVRLGVFVNNPKAKHCYEAAGFQVIAEEELFPFTIEEEVWECIFMKCEKRK